MSPELLDFLKVVVPALLTGLGSYFLGFAKRKAELESIKQQNKDSEFKRLTKLVDELQEENRSYREELREMRSEIHALREQANKEREGYLKRIQQLEAEVLDLRAKLAEATRNKPVINE